MPKYIFYQIYSTHPKANPVATKMAGTLSIPQLNYPSSESKRTRSSARVRTAPGPKISSYTYATLEPLAKARAVMNNAKILQRDFPDTYPRGKGKGGWRKAQQQAAMELNPDKRIKSGPKKDQNYWSVKPPGTLSRSQKTIATLKAKAEVTRKAPALIKAAYTGGGIAERSRITGLVHADLRKAYGLPPKKTK